MPEIATETDERKAAASYINRVSSFIQDTANDVGWEAALPLLDKAHGAYRMGDYPGAVEFMGLARRAALVC